MNLRMTSIVLALLAACGGGGSSTSSTGGSVQAAPARGSVEWKAALAGAPHAYLSIYVARTNLGLLTLSRHEDWTGNAMYLVHRTDFAGNAQANFGKNGSIELSSPMRDADLAAMPSGELFALVTESNVAALPRSRVLAFDSLGQPVANFGSNGSFTHEIGMAAGAYVRFETFEALRTILHPQGKLYLAGWKHVFEKKYNYSTGQSQTSTTKDFSLMCLTPAGKLDPLFHAGVAGPVVLGTSHEATALAPLANGGVAVAGFYSSAAFLMRLQPDATKSANQQLGAYYTQLGGSVSAWIIHDTDISYFSLIQNGASDEGIARGLSSVGGFLVLAVSPMNLRGYFGLFRLESATGTVVETRAVEDAAAQAIVVQDLVTIPSGGIAVGFSVYPPMGDSESRILALNPNALSTDAGFANAGTLGFGLRTVSVKLDSDGQRLYAMYDRYDPNLVPSLTGTLVSLIP